MNEYFVKCDNCGKALVNVNAIEELGAFFCDEKCKQEYFTKE